MNDGMTAMNAGMTAMNPGMTAMSAGMAAMNDGSSMIELAKLYRGKRNGDQKAIDLLQAVAELDRDRASEADVEDAAELLLAIQKRQRRCK